VGRVTQVEVGFSLNAEYAHHFSTLGEAESACEMYDSFEITVPWSASVLKNFRAEMYSHREYAVFCEV
jgi:hypothetical protein